MKSFRKIAIIVFSLFSLFPPDAFAQGAENKSCEDAIELSESVTYYTGDFNDGNLVQPANIPACMFTTQDYPIREFWYKFTTDGISNYYFYCESIIGAMEIYSGDCRTHSLVGCYPSYQSSAYAELMAPPAGTYYLRLVGTVLPVLNNYILDYNSVDPTPSCIVSIDNYSIYPCVDDNGFINLAISGSLDNWDPLINPFVEVETDLGSYFTFDVQSGSTWTANIQVKGTMIENIVVAYGNSSNYCNAVVSNIPLPTEPCNSAPASFTGTFPWNANCYERHGHVSFYQPGTANLIAVYNISVQGAGQFVINYPVLGTFDVIVKLDGYLPKGYTDITIQNAANLLDCGTFIAGELNGDSYINILDASILSFWFSKSTDPAFSHVDFNCDGVINIMEFSVFGSVYGLGGDIAPLGE